MALIDCTECGKEISDSALACPHCMKRKLLSLALTLVCCSVMITGCAGDTTPQKTTLKTTCAKCGKTATTTMYGPAKLLQDSGIPLSACNKVTGEMYSADVCGSCVGLVAEIKPVPILD